MPRSKTWECEVRVTGYVTIEVEASSERIASKKARRAVKYDMGFKYHKFKHGISDEFIDVEDVLVEVVDRG
jgi:hypothetical protein